MPRGCSPLHLFRRCCRLRRFAIMRLKLELEGMTLPERDITEKHLEAYDDVFSDMVNVLLFNGQRRVGPEDLRDTRARTLYKTDGKLREQERDVSKLWVSRGVVISLIGIENQTEIDRDMALRVFGYEGADYRGQLSGDKSLYPVITLVLYFGERHWTAYCCLFYTLRDVCSSLSIRRMHLPLFRLPAACVQAYSVLRHNP